jgi:aspartate ammonia-lyase
VRREHDSLGDLDIPAAAYWGISTMRAVDNFPVSGRTIGTLRSLLWALGAVKYAAARANEGLGLLEPGKSAAIQKASRDVMDGLLDTQFVVDTIQGGAGTSTNMNAKSSQTAPSNCLVM